MRRIPLAAMVTLGALLMAGCASTVPMTIKSAPPGVTKQQIQLDDLECSNMSRTNGPWMYGIGTAIIRSEAAKRFKECMSGKGYVVERGSASASSTTPQSMPATEDPSDAASQAFGRLHPSTSKQQPQAQDAATNEAPAATPAVNSTAPNSPANRLEELDKLYKAGLITKKEYEQKRQQILSTL